VVRAAEPPSRSTAGAKLTAARYPPDTQEKKEKLGGFFQKNPPPGVAKKLPDFVKAAKEASPDVKSWGIIGVSSFSTNLSPTTR
jgi:hypothetical protein